MMKNIRRKAGVAATAGIVAIAGLMVTAPNASAAGNCYYYGMAGYAQIFTEVNYNGDCFEWRM
ncbi:hypothetical protein ACFV7R_39455 [Streptomyces sp. NPDC059866]|uniref:hypothetical protein n=1 Tax=Streptomyces sp. NPDC059866 TaxID=3346978 RepID=UPI0036647C9F